MVKEKKESRLSFRITPDLSEEIDKVVEKSDKVKDRSDFGTKAINLYLAYLKEELILNEAMKDAIVALAKETGNDDLPEMQKLAEHVMKSKQN